MNRCEAILKKLVQKDDITDANIINAISTIVNEVVIKYLSLIANMASTIVDFYFHIMCRYFTWRFAPDILKAQARNIYVMRPF